MKVREAAGESLTGLWLVDLTINKQVLYEMFNRNFSGFACFGLHKENAKRKLAIFNASLNVA